MTTGEMFGIVRIVVTIGHTVLHRSPARVHPWHLLDSFERCPAVSGRWCFEWHILASYRSSITCAALCSENDAMWSWCSACQLLLKMCTAIPQGRLACGLDQPVQGC